MVSFRVLVLAGFAFACGSNGGINSPDANRGGIPPDANALDSTIDGPIPDGTLAVTPDAVDCSRNTAPGDCDGFDGFGGACMTQAQVGAACEEPLNLCKFLSYGCCTCGPQGWKEIYIECYVCPDAGPPDATPDAH